MAYQAHTLEAAIVRHLLLTPVWTHIHKLNLHLFRPTELAMNGPLNT